MTGCFGPLRLHLRQGSCSGILAGFLFGLALGSRYLLDNKVGFLPDQGLLLFYFAAVYGFSFLVLGIFLALPVGAFLSIKGNRPPQPETAWPHYFSFFVVLIFLGLLNSWLHLVALVTWKGLIRFSPALDIAILMAAGFFWIVLDRLCLWYERWRYGKTFSVRCALFLIAGFVAIVSGRLLVSEAYFEAKETSPPIRRSGPSLRGSLPPVSDGVKVFCFALDGLSWNVLMPLVKRGEVPHFASLMEKGAYGSLRTISPTWSPVIWTTIATGKGHDLHGIIGAEELKIPGIRSPVYLRRAVPFVGLDRLFQWFISRGIVRMKRVTLDRRRAKAVWEIATAYQKKVFISGYPFTYRPEPVHGLFLPDLYILPRQRKEWIFPSSYEGLLQEIWTGEAAVHSPKGAVDPMLIGRINAELVDRLYADLRPDFCFLYQKDPDVAAHLYWDLHEPERFFFKVSPEARKRQGDPLEEAYRSMDRLVGRFLERLDDKTVIMIVSDHGAEALPKLPIGWYLRPPSGAHFLAQPGVLILSGPGIKKGYRIQEASVYDVTPTLLHLLGIPVAKDMRGIVLSEALDSSKAHPIAWVETHEGILRRPPPAGSFPDGTVSKEEADRILEGLKSLGYIQ